MTYPSRVKIVEVGPRDGLQNEKNFVPTAAKLEFIQSLSQAGLPEIEITSFVHRDWVPQLTDAEEVTRTVLNRAYSSRGLATVYTVLVPNKKGLERALQSGIRRVALFTAASESFSQKNTNRSIHDSLVEFAPMVEMCRSANVSVRGYISTVFVCPYEGNIAPDQTLEVAEALLEMGVDEVSLGDTVGMAAPREVENLLKILGDKLPLQKLALHLHDTSGTALANLLVGLQMGITTFDSSAGGLGGCPYAPGASGNLATEDLVYMLDRMGIATGVSLPEVLEASAKMARVLGKSLPAHQLSRATNL